jgi:putative ABC transport system ATP-binding protein
MTDQSKTLKAIELTKIFPHPSKENTNIPIFAGASFEMKSNDVNFLIGPSGSGKTTLLRILMGIESINAGEIFLDETAIHQLKGKEKNQYLRNLGYMDQFPAKFLSLDFSVWQNLDYSLVLHKEILLEERKTIIHEIAEHFELTNLLNRKTILLSGGELRKLALACNMIFEPKILLCDEPTSHLDSENKELVMNTISKLNDLFDTLIVIASHDNSIIGSNPTFTISDRRIVK